MREQIKAIDERIKSLKREVTNTKKSTEKIVEITIEAYLHLLNNNIELLKVARKIAKKVRG